MGDEFPKEENPFSEIESDTLDIRPKKRLPMKTITITAFDGSIHSVEMFTKPPQYYNVKTKFEFKPQHNISEETNLSGYSTTDQLADKYAAKSYSELVSDEAQNRDVLNWLRTFSQKRKGEPRPKMAKKGRRKKTDDQEEPDVKLSHILLLAGPPGSGKSTLIKVIAQRCGYYIVELNASDNVTSERNQMLLQNSLRFQPIQMNPDKPTKPLFVIEEADGVGTMHESVMKAIHNRPDQPIVLIVNNLYAGAIRSIRQSAYVVRMKLPNEKKLIQRVEQIAEMENIAINPGAVKSIVQNSRSDIRTTLNTLQFLAAKQPITVESVETMPVGLKNAIFSPYDVWRELFTASTKATDALDLLESFNNNQLISMGIFENLEDNRGPDPTGRYVSTVLDDLCFSDICPENGALGMVNVPRYLGSRKVNPYNIHYPTTSYGYESTIQRNHTILMKDPKIALNREAVDIYCYPPLAVSASISTRPQLRHRFVSFHKTIGIKYIKNQFGHYSAEPDIDSLMINQFRVSEYSKFRSVVQGDLDKIEPDYRVLNTNLRISDRLQKASETSGSTNKKKKGPTTDMFGNSIQVMTQSQTQTYDLFYKYNEGFTNAVKRKVFLSRLGLDQ